MRFMFLLAGTSLLAACGGAGPTTISASAPPGTAGGGGSTATHTFVKPTEIRTYKGIGGAHSLTYSTQNGGTTQSGQLYQGDANSVRNSSISVKFDPRDAIFDVTVSDSKAGVNKTLRFQDPLHRTDFGGAAAPQGGTPNLNIAGMNYLEAGSGAGNIRFDLNQSNIVPIGDPGGSRDVSTFFYQTPGTDTQYVTFAGYLRNQTSVVDNQGVVTQNVTLERGAFAFGEVTQNDNVPTTGTGTYSGAMLATMVFNNQLDINPGAPTYFQWIEGTATTNVDFGANTFSLSLAGTTHAPQFDVNTSRQFSIASGASFNATGAGQIDLVRAGGFLGQFNQAWLVNPNGTRFNLTIAGSSIDGAFYGPNGQEVGGGYRIVGGVPDERIDILGTFVGKGQ